MENILKNIFCFYRDGFRNLTPLSKKLWLLIIIKSTIILVILNLFFPDLLWKYETQEEKSEAVSNSLLRTN